MCYEPDARRHQGFRRAPSAVTAPGGCCAAIGWIGVLVVCGWLYRGDAAGAEPADTTEPQATTAEEINKINALLTEQKKILNEKLASRSKKYNNRFFTKLIDSVDHAEKSVDSIKIVDKNVRINETVNTMIKDIDDMLK